MLTRNRTQGVPVPLPHADVIQVVVCSACGAPIGYAHYNGDLDLAKSVGSGMPTDAVPIRMEYISKGAASFGMEFNWQVRHNNDGKFMERVKLPSMGIVDGVVCGECMVDIGMAIQNLLDYLKNKAGTRATAIHIGTVDITKDPLDKERKNVR